MGEWIDRGGVIGFAQVTNATTECQILKIVGSAFGERCGVVYFKGNVGDNFGGIAVFADAIGSGSDDRIFRMHDGGLRRFDCDVVEGAAIVGCWLLVQLR